MIKGKMLLVYLLCCLSALHATAQQSPFRSDSVLFFNRDSSIRFGATLTVPSQRKNFPAVVLVSGTGKQNRDGLMAGHAMFRVLADSLVRIGFAVLRTDDRGVGATTGVYETATTADFAADALDAADWLRKQPGVGAVGLIGHSEGGAAAIIAAATGKIDFVVTLAGLATRGIDALKLQNQAIINAAPVSDYDKRRHQTITTLMFDTAYRYAYTNLMESKLRTTYNAWKHSDDSAYAKDMPGKYDHMRFFIDSYILQASSAWYQFHLRYDPVPYLERIRVPFLAVNGDKDIMVPWRENLDLVARTLRENGNKVVTVKVLQGLNHLFLRCHSCTNEELSKLPGDFDTTAWEVIKQWLLEYVSAQ